MSRVVLLDESTGLYYSVLTDSIRIRKKRSKKVKFTRNERNVESIRRAKEQFAELDDTRPVSTGLGTMLEALAKGECTSISLAVYRDEFQVTFWEKKGKGSEILASFTFCSPAGFIAGIEGVS